MRREIVCAVVLFLQAPLLLRWVKGRLSRKQGARSDTDSSSEVTEALTSASSAALSKLEKPEVQREPFPVFWVSVQVETLLSQRTDHLLPLPQTATL